MIPAARTHSPIAGDTGAGRVRVVAKPDRGAGAGVAQGVGRLGGHHVAVPRGQVGGREAQRPVAGPRGDRDKSRAGLIEACPTPPLTGRGIPHTNRRCDQRKAGIGRRGAIDRSRPVRAIRGGVGGIADGGAGRGVVIAEPDRGAAPNVAHAVGSLGGQRVAVPGGKVAGREAQ